MMAYMFSYYGLAAAAMLSVLNYCLLGLSYEVDGYYLKSFEIWLACMVVFPGAGNVAFTLLEYRIGHRDLLSALVENLTWIPFLYVLEPINLAYDSTEFSFQLFLLCWIELPLVNCFTCSHFLL